MCGTAMLGYATCFDEMWRQWTFVSALVAMVLFSAVLVLLLTTWAIDARRARSCKEAREQGKRRPSLSLPATHQGLLLAYTPDTRAIVASSRACFLEWTAFAIMPQSPMTTEVANMARSTAAMTAEHPRRRSSEERELPALGEVRSPGSQSNGMRSQSVKFHHRRVRRLMTRNNIWDPATDDVEAAEAVGITSHSPASVAINMQPLASELASANDGLAGLPASGLGSEPVQVVAADKAGAPGFRLYGPCMRRWFGATAAGNLRRATTLAVFSDVLYNLLVLAISSANLTTVATVAAVESLTWLANMWIVLIILWYWLRLSRSASRLRTIHHNIGLRNSGMVGQSNSWRTYRTSGGLAAPLDATADPYAGSVLLIVATVAIAGGVAGTVAALSNALDHIGCDALTESPEEHAAHGKHCQVKAFPGMTHASTVSIAYFLIAIAAANAGSSLLARFRQLTQRSETTAQVLQARRRRRSQEGFERTSSHATAESLLRRSLQPHGRKVAPLAPSSAAGESASGARRVPRNSGTGSVAMAVGAAMLCEENPPLAPSAAEAPCSPKVERLSAASDEGPVLAADSPHHGGEGSLFSTSIPHSFVVGSRFEARSSKEVVAAVKEAEQWKATHARLRTRINIFCTVLILIGLGGIGDVVTVTLNGAPPQAFVVAKAVHVLLRLSVQLTVWRFVTCVRTLARIEHLFTGCGESAEEPRVAAVSPAAST